MQVPRLAGWSLALLALLACCAALVAHFEIGLNSDNQLYLEQTQRWLRGRSLYTSLVMPSPPMIFALYAPLVAAKSAGISFELGFDLWTTALIAASLLLCHHIILCRAAPRDRLERALLLALIATGLVVLPLRDNVFGDRDHLFAVLFTPYLLLLSPYGAAAAAGPRARLLIGACAAIGLGIKPYFLAIWGMQQLYWMLRERSLFGVLRRLETRAAAAGFAAYALAVAWLTPEYLRTITPMAWATYPAISPPLAQRAATLESVWTTTFALPLVCCTGLFARGSPALRANIAYALCLGVGASASGFAGGWHYAWYPLYLFAFAFAASVIAALFAAARECWPASRALAAGFLLAGAFLCAMPIYTQLCEPARARAFVDLDLQRRTGWPRGHQRALASTDQFLAKHLGVVAQPRFLLLGNGMWDARLVDFDPARTSVSRFYALWPLPALVAAERDPERAAAMAWIRSYLLEAATQDLQGGRPDVVIVENSLWMWGLPRRFDVLGFFLSDPRFARAWRDYAFVARNDDCARWPNYCAFDVYYRKDLVP